MESRFSGDSENQKRLILDRALRLVKCDILPALKDGASFDLFNYPITLIISTVNIITFAKIWTSYRDFKVADFKRSF